MIADLDPQACTDCGTCISVCPTNVFEKDTNGHAVIARLDDCQTCFLCELYCPEDALYVAPDCEAPRTIDRNVIIASGLRGKFRRDSGWNPAHPNVENGHWRMDEIFRRAREAADKAKV